MIGDPSQTTSERLYMAGFVHAPAGAGRRDIVHARTGLTVATLDWMGANGLLTALDPWGAGSTPRAIARSIYRSRRPLNVSHPIRSAVEAFAACRAVMGELVPDIEIGPVAVELFRIARPEPADFDQPEAPA